MLLETFVDGNGNLPEGYGPGVDVLECKMILGFDSYPQVADHLVLCNPDREGIVGGLGVRVIAEDPTQEYDVVGHHAHRSQLISRRRARTSQVLLVKVGSIRQLPRAIRNQTCALMVMSGDNFELNGFKAGGCSVTTNSLLYPSHLRRQRPRLTGSCESCLRCPSCNILSKRAFFMPDSASFLRSLPHDDDETDLRLEKTVAAVDWDVLASVTRSLFGVISSRWGDQIPGGYNVVRFLHLDDVRQTVLVVRLPYRPAEGWTIEWVNALASRMSSEVATMRYIATHTNIPVPHVIYNSVEPDGGGVGSPYMVMSRVDGMPLSSVWDNMEDTKREIILRQVIDILLELVFHRFDKIGALFQRDGDNATKQTWYVAPMTHSPDDNSISKAIPSITFTSALDYWLAYANANLESIHNSNFGLSNKIYQYGHAWFMRSLIPALYNPSLDTAGFPICPGDFHSQNIMIVDADTSPRITAVIDWEFSGTHATSSFAQYPLFIVDHPHWDCDNSLRQRNVHDQAIFNVFMREAEMKRDPEGGLPLSRAFANCRGVYLFEQAIQFPYMFPQVYPQLFAHVFGEEKSFSVDYYLALMHKGILRGEASQFKKEHEVWCEASNMLGDELVSRNMNREEFRRVVQHHMDRFAEEGLVREWLATYL